MRMDRKKTCFVKNLLFTLSLYQGIFPSVLSIGVCLNVATQYVCVCFGLYSFFAQNLFERFFLLIDADATLSSCCRGKDLFKVGFCFCFLKQKTMLCRNNL